jgi:large subunit ribosomal protein L18
MGSLNAKKKAHLKRKTRIRKRIFGSSERPRMSVFRSARHIYVQVIDDTDGKTIVSAASTEKPVREHADFENKIAVAIHVGKIIAQRALEKGITKVVFDRNGFLYHGRVKAVSDGAREAGLNF